MTEMNRSNQRYWDALAEEWQAMRDEDQLWRLCQTQPELAFDGEALTMLRHYAGDLHGKRACVIGSGDNYAAFALAGMGARVTSTDISPRQLAVAEQRAGQLGLEMDFVQADATRLDGVPSAQFDLVCSSNGFFVWIAEPAKVFQQVFRVLKPGGFYIFYDIHPFQRPWKDQTAPIEVEKAYAETGPFVFKEKGQTCYEFNWRLSDLLNPLCNSGLVLRQFTESPARDARFWEGHSYTPGQDSRLLDWRFNPRTALPVWMTVVAQKPTNAVGHS